MPFLSPFWMLVQTCPFSHHFSTQISSEYHIGPWPEIFSRNLRCKRRPRSPLWYDNTVVRPTRHPEAPSIVPVVGRSLPRILRETTTVLPNKKRKKHGFNSCANQQTWGYNFNQYNFRMMGSPQNYQSFWLLICSKFGYPKRDFQWQRPMMFHRRPGNPNGLGQQPEKNIAESLNFSIGFCHENLVL